MQDLFQAIETTPPVMKMYRAMGLNL